MAKDKGKKKDLAEGFAKPSDAKGGGEGWRFESEDNLGKLFLITPLRVQDAVGFEGKEAEVIVADIVLIDEKKPERSEEHDEVFVWGGWTKGALRGYIGEARVLGRLQQDKSKGRGKNAAWVLEDATKKDAEIATAYMTAANDPFKGKGSKKGEKPAAESKPAKAEKPAKKKSKK